MIVPPFSNLQVVQGFPNGPMMAGSEAFVGGLPLVRYQAVCCIVSASSWDDPWDFGAFPVTQPFLSGRVFMEQVGI